MPGDTCQHRFTGFECVGYAKLVWSVWNRGSEELFCCEKSSEQLVLLVVVVELKVP